MDKAIVNLQQCFTAPSADLIEQNPQCGICWDEYHREDRPVKLPCGHVFGENCVSAWARGTTPTGRYNGCPNCRAEILPPSLHSRIGALLQWLCDLWPVVKLAFGGLQGVVLVFGLTTMIFRVERSSEPQVATRVRIGMMWLLTSFLTIRIAILFGWRQAIPFWAAQAVCGFILGRMVYSALSPVSTRQALLM